jgi:hypothetical protein
MKSSSQKIPGRTKIFGLILAFALSAGILNAQSVGASAYFLGFSVVNPDDFMTVGNGQRALGHMSSFSPGVRVEANFLVPALASGFNGLGFSYFFPHPDSAFFYGRLNNNNTGVDVLGKEVSTSYMISFRFGYQIPQSFNDFLMINVGWGFGFQHTKTWYELPEKSATFNYDKSDFDPATFEPGVDARPFFELLLGGTYEFEKFYVAAHYSFMRKFSNSAGYEHRYEKYRHGLTAGIYFPLYRF